MTWSVYINEVALDAIGVWVEDVQGLLDPLQRTFPQVAMPGRDGVAIVADPETGGRTLTLVGSIDPPARTVAARVAAEDQLKALAKRGVVSIVADNDVTAPRRIDGVSLGGTVATVGHPMVSQVSRFSLPFLCADPVWTDVTAQVIAFGATPSAIPLGTATSGGIVRIAAPTWSANVVDPVLEYLNAAGVLCVAMPLAGTLVAGTDYLEVDLGRKTIVKYSSGVASNAIAWLGATADFPPLDPNDGDVLRSSYPQLRVTATSGTPSGTWLGFRRWE